jgi:hypothetical protein
MSDLTLDQQIAAANKAGEHDRVHELNSQKLTDVMRRTDHNGQLRAAPAAAPVATVAPAQQAYGDAIAAALESDDPQLQAAARELADDAAHRQALLEAGAGDAGARPAQPSSTLEEKIAKAEAAGDWAGLMALNQQKLLQLAADLT